MRLPPRQTVRADFPHTAFHRVLFLLPWTLPFFDCLAYYTHFFLSIPRPPHVRPREAVEAVVRHLAVVGVRELKSVVPLALPVEEPRHALQHIVVHLAENP